MGDVRADGATVPSRSDSRQATEKSACNWWKQWRQVDHCVQCGIRWQAEGSQVQEEKDMAKVKCFNCDQLGHFARDRKNEQTSQITEAASMAFTVSEMAEVIKRGWIVDSGATSHMTGHLDNLTSVRTVSEPRVLTMASGDYLLATAMGQVPLHLNGREVCVLQDVIFVEGLAHNLVSVAAASRRGMTVDVEGTSCVSRSPSVTTP
ncbi:unnamed protein product [Phytophthora fragariaefolia]|uniref:Unnamed protein product n=1 Tax=Phytophthora fragariaefolia TaxID=1490495 RepID=A0A9W7CQG2_9STRA|nr:unnamed protein product [Phytophthora fragariaefolia]